MKWLNATADIPNNPYSPEALEKRLQGSMNSIGIFLSAPQESMEQPVSVVSNVNSESEREVGEVEVEKEEKDEVVVQQQQRTLQEVLGETDAEKIDFKR